MTSILPELVKIGVQFLLTGNAVAAAASIGVLCSAASNAIKLAAVPCFLTFGVGLISGVLMLAFYLGYLIELEGNRQWAKSVFNFLAAFWGLLSVIGFILGVVLAMHAVLVLRSLL